MAFPAILPRRLSMTLRSIITFPLHMPFLNMKYATRTMLQNLFAKTGMLLSISNGIVYNTRERKRVCFSFGFEDLDREREREREREKQRFKQKGIQWSEDEDEGV